MSIHYINNSSVVDAASFQNAIDDIHLQLSNEFAFAWGLPHFVATLTIADTIDVPGALGYHDIDSQFHPYAIVDAKLAEENGIPWSLVASHEALEMAANPYVDRIALLDPAGTGISGELIWNEICDAVERGSYAGRLHSTPLSNFVLPGWFIPGWSGPVDHLGQVPGPLQIASGGYIAAEPFQGQGWQDYTAFLARKVQERKIHYL